MTYAENSIVLGASCSLGNVDTGSVDSKIQNGFYQHTGAIRTGGDWGVLFVYKGAVDYIIQHDFDFTSNSYFIRYSTNRGSSWSEWHSVPTDIPSFYKDYSSLAILASAIGVKTMWLDNGGDTGIQCNVEGVRGNAWGALVVCSDYHAGEKTSVFFQLLRFDISGNHVTCVNITQSLDDGVATTSPTYSVSNNGTIIANKSGCYTFILQK